MVLIDLGSAANLALCLQRADNTENQHTQSQNKLLHFLCY